MQTLIESTPDAPVIVALAETHLADVFAAQDAIDRVLDGTEKRGDFSDEDTLVLDGLAAALRNDRYMWADTAHVRLVPPKESKVLLGALRLFASMPDDERAGLSTQTEHHQAFMSIAFAQMQHVTLDPGVRPKDVFTTVPMAEMPDEEPVAQGQRADVYLFDTSVLAADRKKNKREGHYALFADELGKRYVWDDSTDGDSRLRTAESATVSENTQAWAPPHAHEDDHVGV